MKSVVPPRTPTCPPARIEVPLPSIHRLMFPLVCFGEGTGEETVLILFCLKPEGLHLRCCSGSAPQGSDGLPPPHPHLAQPVHLADLDPSSSSLQPWYGQGRAGQGFTREGIWIRERAWDKPWAGRFERGAGTQHWEGEEARSPEGWVSPAAPLSTPVSVL